MAEETSSAGGSVGTARIDVVVNTATMDVGIEAAKHRVSGLGDQAAAEFDKANASTKRYAESLLRQAEMLNKTRAEQIAYNAQTRIGGELGDQIAARALANQSKIGAAVGGTGKSVKELQFAMRGLPAQITDIFTSIASGQRPMMVLLQQGGQLKDMFGGIRPAAAALGGSLLGLVNPYTVTAVAAGALLLAWKQGEDEAVAYSKALIATGGYAGKTAGELSDMAKGISQNVGTQHEAAAALAEVTAAGKFTADQLALVARASVDASRVNGQATAETIKQFESLKNDPVKAILALNDAQHFLTLATYDRIKALEEEGRQQDAATLAMQTYSQALDQRRAEVVNNAGLIERAWDGVAIKAKGAWDAMLDVGRPESTADQLKKASAAVQARESDLAPALGFNNPAGLFLSQFLPGGNYDTDKELQDLKSHEKELRDKLAREQKDAAATALTAQIVQDKADSDREVQAFAINAQKHATEIARVQGEYRDRIARAEKAGNQKLAGELRDSEKLVLAGVNQKYKDPKQPKSPEISAYQTFKGQVAALHIPNVTADNAALTQYQQGVAKLADEMAVYMQKGGDATKAAALFNQGQKELAQTLVRNRQQEIDAEKAYADALDKSNQVLADQVNAQIERIGSGQKEYERTTQITKAYRDQAAALQDLALKRQMGVDGKSGGISQDQYDADAKKLKAATDQKVRILQDGFKRQDAAQADWLNGASMAYHDYVDQAADVASQTYDLFNNAFTGLSDSLASFVTTGKLDFKGLAASILSDLAKMEARILASKILQGIVGGFLGNSGGNGEMATSFDSNGTFFSPYAKGGVFANSPSLSAYSGQVVSQPTMFAFARGAGVMGEAGPEAIMPLRRGSDGRLGVVAAGSGGDMSISQTFVIDSNGGSTGQAAGYGDDNLRKFAGKMKGIAQQAILDEQRPGGSLWRMGQRA